MAACTLGNLFLQLSNIPASHLIFRGAVTTFHYRLRKFYLPVGNNCFQICGCTGLSTSSLLSG